MPKRKRDPLPPLEPMLATLVANAFDDEAWAFEPKWDGVRALAVVDKELQLITRNRKDVAVAYPELQEITRRLDISPVVLDGEIVAFENGVPSFERLQSRIHVRGAGEIARLMKSIPVIYVAFDVIYLGDKSLTGETYDERRRLLEEHLRSDKIVQISPAIQGEGTDLFEAARQQGLEGIVAKLRSSRYEPGRRSKAWLKVKTTFEADVVIAGWVPGGGRRTGRLGSLVMAVYDDGDLRYVGGVGTGFTEKTLDAVHSELEPLETTKVPFPPAATKGKAELRHAHWVRPKLVAAVEFRQLTSAGKLRAPSFKGLREDKTPKECTYDELRAAAGLKT